MTRDEMIQRRNALEVEINRLIHDFQTETQMVVTEIDCGQRFVEVTRFDGQTTRHSTGHGVRVSVLLP